MSKLVRRFKLGNLWECGKNESWFSDMALKGLHLQSVGNLLVTFEKEEPKKTKYRIEILEESPSQDQLDLYKEYGWELVANNQIFYIFSSPEELNAPELHTDPMEQSCTLKMLNKQLKKNMVLISILFLSFLSTIFNHFFSQDEIYLILIRQRSFAFIMLAIPYMYVVFESIRGYFVIKKIKNSLLIGIPIKHNENWKLNYLFSCIFYVYLIAMIITLLFTPYYKSVQRGLYKYMAVEDMPTISINNIETGPVYDYWHNVRYDWGLLSPKQLSISESGYVESKIQDELSGAYTSTNIHIDYYELAFKGMAEGLLNDLINRYHREYKYDDELVKIEDRNFDRLYVDYGEEKKFIIFDRMYVDKGEETKLIFASFDKKVIQIRYTGNADIERIITLMEEKYEL